MPDNYQLNYTGREIDTLLKKVEELPDGGYQLTDTEKAEIVNAVIAALPKYNGEVS